MGAPSSFDIVGPGGRRVTVVPRSAADTVADLLAAMGHARDAPTWIDGRPVPTGRRLVDVRSLLVGSTVDVRCEGRSPTSDGRPEPVVEISVIAGPACRGWTALPVGRHTIGRSEHCALRLADATVELYHAVVDVEADGTVLVTQLTGRVPARVDGEPCAGGVEFAPGAVLQLGASLLRMRRTAPDHTVDRGRGSIVAGPDPWRLVVRRGPVDEPDRVEPELTAPAPVPDHPAPPATGLIGAVVGVAGALVVASVMGQMMFALFALVGAVASLATWIVGVTSTLQRRRRARRDHAARVMRFRADVEAAIAARRDDLRRRHRPVTSALDEVGRLGGRMWERRLDGEVPLPVTVGLGSVRWSPAVVGEASLAPDVVAAIDRDAVGHLQPVPVELERGVGLAVHGDAAVGRSVLRSMLIQLATWVGPADLQLVVVARDPGRWTWAGWLPHTRQPDGSRGVVGSDDVEGIGARLVPGRATVVVTDDPALFESRTGPLRRLVAATDAAVVAAVAPADTVPSICRRVLALGSNGRSEWVAGPVLEDLPDGLHVAGLDEQTAATAARRMAALVDPEDAAEATARIPRDLSAADLDRLTAAGARADDGDAVAEVAERWRAAGADPPPRTPIGVSADGVVDIDLVRDGPHGLIAGTTGSGKSELLRSLVLGLAARCSPDHLTFVLVDYKGGSTFDACARLPHTVGLVTDLDDGGAARALTSLEAELRRRERRLRSVGAADLTDYRRRVGTAPLARLVVVVDEFAALVQELPDFVPSLVGIAQRGRSLGVHLVLATQRPAGVVSDEIRANTNLRLALRLHDVADARDVVGADLPATLPRGLPGRAVLRLGPSELVVFQAARCAGPVVRGAGRLTVMFDDGEPGTPVPAAVGGRPGAPVAAAGGGVTELSATVDVIAAAAERLGLAPPPRPWLDPLPARLDPTEVERVVGAGGDHGPGGEPHDAIGVVDDPANQARHALCWDLSGNLAVVGPHGFGATSTLVALTAALCRTRPPDELHIFVVDALGDPALDGIGAIAHCGAVVRARETERLHRLLRRLDDELAGRAAGVGSGVRTVLLVDGFDSLRSALAHAEGAETWALLERIAADGPAVGVVCVATGPDVARLPSAERWRFDSPGSARVPGRLTVESTGLVAQVACGAPGLAALPDRTDGRGPHPVDVLAERVDAASLGPSWSSGDRHDPTDHLVLGRGADRLDDAALSVPAGDHVFVGGPSGSGKSTALRVMAAAWRRLHPDGLVVAVGRRDATGLELPDHRPLLVVVDDADRIDSPVLADLAADHRPGVTLLVAARVEAVRVSYGHWTRDVARRRCGIVLTSSGEVDGELLGATLPQRTLIPPRPGLAWVIDARGHRLVQLATIGEARARTPAPVAVQAGGRSPRR